MKCSAAYTLLAGLFTVLNLSILEAQPPSAPGRPDMTFGTVYPENFSYSADSSAHAVYLFDHGQVVFDDWYRRGSFGVIFERHARILLLHKSAFSLATLSLSTYRKANYMIEDFKGATYNLENGSVTVSKLDKSNIFKDHNGNFDIEKVAFPNVKEGSIIEYSYRILYQGIGYIPAWHFQGSYPELWSEYDITVPRLFDYAVKMQGYERFIMDTVIAYDDNIPSLAYSMSDRAFYARQSARHIWAAQNVPALEKAEPYTTTLKNHMAKVEFQLASTRQNGAVVMHSSTWPQLTHELLKAEHFGDALDDHNHWMDDELKKITAGSASNKETIQRIYTYVRDHFTCLSLENMYTSQPIKKTWDDKKGTTIGDINLLLTALYRHLGLDAAPVILSTRSNGYAQDSYPLVSEYNYVITRVRTPGNDYLLDASKPSLGFGQLAELCYNGWARVIDSTHDRIALMADSIRESRRTLVVLANTDSGFTGSYTRHAGVFESMGLRNQMRKSRSEDFFENLHRSLPENRQMGATHFDSLDVPESTVTWGYQMKYRFSSKTVYFNPVFHERFNNSPFGAAERHYPVEMPYCIDNFYELRMETPKGYTVEQLPQSQRIILEDSSGVFEYRVEQDGNNLNCRIRLRLTRAVYPVEKYPMLQRFFSLIVNKEKEPIVFKKNT